MQLRGFTPWKPASPAVRGSPALIFWGRRRRSIDKMDRRGDVDGAVCGRPQHRNQRPGEMEERKTPEVWSYFWFVGREGNIKRGTTKAENVTTNFGFGRFPFPIIGYKKWPPSMKKLENWKISSTKEVERNANGPV